MKLNDLTVMLILICIGLIALTAVSYDFLGKDSPVTKELEEVDEEIIESVL